MLLQSKSHMYCVGLKIVLMLSSHGKMFLQLHTKFFLFFFNNTVLNEKPFLSTSFGEMWKKDLQKTEKEGGKKMTVRQIYTNLRGVIVIELFGTILINTIKEIFDYISKNVGPITLVCGHLFILSLSLCL